jgi:hypothetical protein
LVITRQAIEALKSLLFKSAIRPTIPRVVPVLVWNPD